MNTIQSLKSRRVYGPIKTPIRVKVAATSKPYQYGPTEDKKLLNMSLCDATDKIRAVCFDTTKFSSFKVNAGLVLHNVNFKDGEFIINQQSRVFQSAAPEVADDILKAAVDVIHPPKPEVIAISDAKKSPKKQPLSVTGRVVNQGLPTTATINSQNVPVKTITIRDDTDEVNISLWRDLAEADVPLGEYVEISHVIVNERKYRNEENLSTTQFTEIKTTEMPERNFTEEVLGCDLGDVASFLLTAEKGVFNIENEKLSQFFECVLEDIPNQFPRLLNLVVKGENVVNILN